MKKLLFLLLFSNITISQNTFNTENFSVSNSDIELNTFKQDTTANALVIYEFGNAEIDKKRFNLIFNYQKKVKILNRNGFDKANVSIYLYNSGKNKEKIKNLVATTTNLENGTLRRTNLDASQVFEEKVNANYTIYKFTLPDIKEGSVITYSYTLESPFIYKFQPWYFQEDIPKLYSEYNTSIPGNYNYNIKLVGELPLKANSSQIQKRCIERSNGATADCTVSKYSMENIPAFIEEEYMTAAKNYLSRIEYELKIIKGFDGSVKNITKSWESADVELKYDDNFGKQLKKEKLVKNLIDKESLSLFTNDLDKAKYIFDFVKNNYTWNKYYRIFKDVSLKDIIEEKSGNVAEINLLLYNLLKKHNIKVYPILISTRDNGFVTKLYPVISEFNYIILRAEINGESYFLDATNPSLVFGQIPFECLNEYGREINFEDGSRWVDINLDSYTSSQYNVNININDDNTFSGTVTIIKIGYKALETKKRYRKNETDYLKYYKNTYPDCSFEDLKIEQDDSNNSTFTETFSISAPLTTIGDKIYLDPFIFKFLSKNPLQLNTRTYPVDFGYKDLLIYNIKINTNNKYKILDLPEDKSIQLVGNSGLLVFKNKKEDNLAELYFRTNFKNSIYPTSYYTELKSFFKNMVDIQNNSVFVLQKSN
ncbi:DUF3857 domain-containing protein [Olleya aquimaris]|uniref:Uncharacterized protein DUF3857 n=1 Tax=Olleya aquimaris TaxID=639310 RepID=A0A327RJL6_9FLAO|nr:DUF3857 domain-containing protein [Olleya aquimaris]RAJ17129.1 uncharacterized protein DUF3857 [Olleya aquimaris]